MKNIMEISLKSVEEIEYPGVLAAQISNIMINSMKQKAPAS